MERIEFRIIIDKTISDPPEIEMVVTGNTRKDLTIKMDDVDQCGGALQSLGISLRRHFDKDLKEDFREYLDNPD